MYIREVTVQLKPNSQAKFTQTIENEIIPMLRREKGFKDEFTFVSSFGNKAVGISFWDKKADAEAYNTKTYQQVLKSLSTVVEGIPQVQTGEVSNSTWHKITAQTPAMAVKA